jgi:hypothetical protein
MIRPEIGKLPKSLVDRIPLVIYIPPPPDEPSNGPITLPDTVFSYPPKQSPSKKPKRRFAFLKRMKTKQKDEDEPISEKQDRKRVHVGEPVTWEDHWEQGDYPFVRLEGNRAACAICLMDFEEPKRIVGIRGQRKKELILMAKTEMTKGMDKYKRSRWRRKAMRTLKCS